MARKARPMTEPEFDENGYPTEATLRRIRTWPIGERGSCEALLDFIGRAWWRSDWGWRKGEDLVPTYGGRKERVYEVSTGGWSGNESLIGAFEQNRVAWMICWVSSRRGGHYEFRVIA